MIYATHTRVASVEERIQILRAHKQGDDVVVEKANLGWFVRFEGSWESIFLGDTKPAFVVGDRVKISFEKVTHG